MDKQQATDEIVSRVNVSRQDVVFAKSFILKNFDEKPDEMLRRMLEHLEIQQPETLNLNESVALSQIGAAASTFSWKLAFAEALWGLVGSGLVLPMSSNVMRIRIDQGYSSGGTRYRGGLTLDEFLIKVPNRVRMAPSRIFSPLQPLSDADLFISDLDIQDIHPEIEAALRDAVRCFRNELYLPSLAMLGLASEGAWIELGLALLDSCKDKRGLIEKTREKKREELNNRDISVVRKLEAVAKLYERKDIFGDVVKRSGFNHRALAQVLNWSNVVRDARNAIHYGTEPAVPNNYEKVAALLLGASQNLRIIYAIMMAAREL
jgi:hypothetical protein